MRGDVIRMPIAEGRHMIRGVLVALIDASDEAARIVHDAGWM